MTTEETVPALEAVQPETQEAVQEAQQKSPEESSQDRNWKEARNALKEVRRQNEELKAYISEIAAKQNQSAQPAQEEPAPDDWVTQKGLRKEMEELKATMKAREADTVVDRLKVKYADFDDVVSPDNVEYLKENDPELARSLMALADDPYQQGIAAYKLLKRTDYYMNRDAMKEKKRIEENQAKPPSVNQVRKASPLAEANKFDRGLTPELRKQLWQEMQEAVKNA